MLQDAEVSKTLASACLQVWCALHRAHFRQLWVLLTSEWLTWKHIRNLEENAACLLYLKFTMLPQSWIVDVPPQVKRECPSFYSLSHSLSWGCRREWHRRGSCRCLGLACCGWAWHLDVYMMSPQLRRPCFKATQMTWSGIITGLIWLFDSPDFGQLAALFIPE